MRVWSRSAKRRGAILRAARNAAEAGVTSLGGDNFGRFGIALLFTIFILQHFFFPSCHVHSTFRPC